MKKLIAISFLFVFLSANTELHELLRLPILVQHYLEHHDKEPDETFADFLKEHYTDNQNSSDKHHDHDNLPFKTTDCAMAHVSLAFVNPIQYTLPRITVFHNTISPIYYGNFYSSTVVCNIWQPPKIS